MSQPNPQPDLTVNPLSGTDEGITAEIISFPESAVVRRPTLGDDVPASPKPRWSVKGGLKAAFDKVKSFDYKSAGKDMLVGGGIGVGVKVVAMSAGLSGLPVTVTAAGLAGVLNAIYKMERDRKREAKAAGVVAAAFWSRENGYYYAQNWKKLCVSFCSSAAFGWIGAEYVAPVLAPYIPSFETQINWLSEKFGGAVKAVSSFVAGWSAPEMPMPDQTASIITGLSVALLEPSPQEAHVGAIMGGMSALDANPTLSEVSAPGGLADLDIGMDEGASPAIADQAPPPPEVLKPDPAPAADPAPEAPRAAPPEPAAPDAPPAPAVVLPSLEERTTAFLEGHKLSPLAQEILDRADAGRPQGVKDMATGLLNKAYGFPLDVQLGLENLDKAVAMGSKMAFEDRLHIDAVGLYGQPVVPGAKEKLAELARTSPRAAGILQGITHPHSAPVSAPRGLPTAALHHAANPSSLANSGGGRISASHAEIREGGRVVRLVGDAARALQDKTSVLLRIQ